MAAVLARARAELRARWRAWLGLSLLLGLAGGVVLVLVAGARRTDTAYDRLLAAERPADLEVQVGDLADAGVPDPLAALGRLGRLPGVTEHGLFAQFTADPGDNSTLTTDWYFDTLAPVDQGAERFVARWKLLAGRRADPARADEAVVGFTMAERYGLWAGSRLRLRLFSRRENEALYQDGTLARLPGPSEGRRVDLRVVGIVAPAGDFPPRVGVAVGTVLAAAPAAEHASVGTLAVLEVGADGPSAIAWAAEPLRGSVAPTVIEGRPPAGPDEILLGTRTLRAAGAHVGDQVEVRLQAVAWQPLEGPVPAHRLRVVGRGVFPLEEGAVGDGAAITYDGLAWLAPGPARPPRNLLLLRWAPGTDAAQAAAGLAGETPRLIYPTQPADVANFGRIQNLPVLLAALVAAVATAMLAHVLVTSVRRRRRDLAVLKTLGFVRGQVSLTVAWQATTLLTLALLVGLPVGVAAGRWLWTLFAARIYVLPEPVMPLTAILLAPAAVLVANLVAAVPAWMAARTSRATVLRSE